MASDLSSSVEGTPERFVPEQMRGTLVEAEHLARYWWAAGLARDRVVLDAGCGVAYGSVVLAEAGAARVVGVDLSAPVLEAMEGEVPPGVELREADVRDLPFESGTFGLVVCFEVIEHVAEQDAVLDELARVLSDDGILAVSSPNRDATVPGNPHHVREYLPSELLAAVASRLPQVRAVRQVDFVASVLLEDDALAPTGRESLGGLAAGKAASLEPGRELYTVVLGSRRPLPATAPAAALTDTLEVRRWVELYDEQRRVLEEQAAALARIGLQERERLALQAQLEAAEAKLSHTAELTRGFDEADQMRRELAVDRAKVVEHRDELAFRLAELERSRSWRLTAPLRLGTRLARQFGRRR